MPDSSKSRGAWFVAGEDGWFANYRAGSRRISARVAGRIGIGSWDKARAGRIGPGSVDLIRAWLGGLVGRAMGEVVPGREQARREMVGWGGQP